VRLAFRF